MIIKKTELALKDECIRQLEKNCRVVVGEDEVIMKKKDVEEKDEQIKELEKRTAGIGDDEVIIKKTELALKDECIRQLEKDCRVVVGEDEVIMKKKDVGEKDEQIRRLEEDGLEIQQDQILMNKAHVETLVSKIEDFEKVDEDPTAKCIVMRNFQMLIRIDHYESMKNRCIELEKQVKEVGGEE